MQLFSRSLPYIAAALVCGSIAIGVNSNFKSDIDEMKRSYIQEQKLETAAIATNLESHFKAFYQGLRTMTLLPGVRNIDRYGKSFHPDSKLAMQQIYNNTYVNVTLSEVYILPRELDPERIDPITKKPEEPIITFDEFIVGPAKAENEAEEGEKLEETEIYEYRLMKKQLIYLREHFPNNKSFKGIDIPGVMGEPVITCDNSEFTKADLDSHNDKPRMGFVYTLPVYNAEGDFNGAISGVVRLNVLEKLIPEGNYALTNSLGYRGVTNMSKAVSDSVKDFESGSVNPHLIYSEVRKLAVVDSVPWEFWSAVSDDKFYAQDAVLQAQKVRKFGLGASFLLFCILAIGVRFAQRNQVVLERKVAEKTSQLSKRNHSMRLILDNAEQGFLTCELDGSIGSEYSKAIEGWFGKPREGQRIWDFLFDADNTRVATMFSMGWDQLTAEFLPFEVTADQMPKSFSFSGRHFSLSYTGIRDAEEKLQQLLIVASDVTAVINAGIKEREQQELLSMFQRISHDRVGFLEFFEDAERLVEALHNSKNAEEQFRIVHTLKGNCGQYGLPTVVEPCHVLESQLNETRSPLSHSEIAVIAQIWQQTSSRLVSLLGDRKKRTIELDESVCRDIVQRLKGGSNANDIADSIERWCLDPLGARLLRFAEDAKFLSSRLGVEDLDVEVQDQGIHLEPGSFAEIWSNMTHVIRNAVDHGLRGLEGVRPKLTFSAEREADKIRIRISDNGHGVSWEKVREKAKSAGIPYKNAEDLVNALFYDGLSTKSSVSETSGRGVGMSALKAAVLNYGGAIHVESEVGKGTSIIMELPLKTHKERKAT